MDMKYQKIILIIIVSYCLIFVSKAFAKNYNFTLDHNGELKDDPDKMSEDRNINKDLIKHLNL